MHGRIVSDRASMLSIRLPLVLVTRILEKFNVTFRKSSFSRSFILKLQPYRMAVYRIFVNHENAPELIRSPQSISGNQGLTVLVEKAGSGCINLMRLIPWLDPVFIDHLRPKISGCRVLDL